MHLRTWITLVSAVLAAVAFAAVGCASQESSDGEQAAMAVAPGDDETGSTPGGDRGEWAGNNGEFSARLTSEVLKRAAEASSDPRAGEIVESLGLSPDSDQCGGEPCDICDIGWYSATDYDEDLSIHSCCSGEGCLHEFQFGEGQRRLGLFGPPVEPTRFGPDSIVLEPRGATEADGRVWAGLLKLLEKTARRADDRPAVVGVADLGDEARWRLDVDEIHRLEALPARAIQEAREGCQQGVHLPTLGQMSPDASPRSERLELQFERWLDDREVLLTATTDGTHTSRLRVDVDSMCMVRTSDPSGASIDVDVQVGPELWWHGRQTRRLATDDGPVVVVRGQLLGVVEPGLDRQWAAARQGLKVTGRNELQPADEFEIRVLRRHVSDAELRAWRAGKLDDEQLGDPGLEVPVRSRDAQRSIPVTIVVEDEEAVDELLVEVE